MKRLTVLCLLALGCVEDAADDAPEFDLGAAADATTADATLDASSAPDAAPDGEVDAAPPADCATPCARLADCVDEACPFDADPAEVVAACEAACAENPAFAAVAEGTETCADLAAFGAQTVGEPVASACPNGGPVDVPACQVYGARIADCIVERCPLAEPDRALHAHAYDDLCNRAVSNGGIDPAALERTITPETPCDAEPVRNAVDLQLVDTPERDDDGSMARYCAEGPLHPRALCAAACAVVAPCLTEVQNPDTAQYGDPLRCEHLCLVSQNVTRLSWQCTADAEGQLCESVLACFQPEPIEGCEGWADRAVACTAEACPPMAPIGAGLRTQLVPYCNNQVQQANLTEAQVDAVGAETPCDDPTLAPHVDFILAVPEIERACAEGLLYSPELCDAACVNLSACTPQDQPASDPDYCTYVCQLEPDLDEAAWACVRDADGCPAVGACFQ